MWTTADRHDEITVQIELKVIAGNHIRMMAHLCFHLDWIDLSVQSGCTTSQKDLCMEECIRMPEVDIVLCINGPCMCLVGSRWVMYEWEVKHQMTTDRSGRTISQLKNFYIGHTKRFFSFTSFLGVKQAKSWWKLPKMDYFCKDFWPEIEYCHPAKFYIKKALIKF